MGYGIMLVEARDRYLLSACVGPFSRTWTTLPSLFLLLGALAMEALHRQVLPFLLRRMKEDVLQDLPPKIIQDYHCDLSPLQVQSNTMCDVMNVSVLRARGTPTNPCACPNQNNACVY